MNAKISVFVIRAEAIILLLLHNLHDTTFKSNQILFGMCKTNCINNDCARRLFIVNSLDII